MIGQRRTRLRRALRRGPAGGREATQRHVRLPAAPAGGDGGRRVRAVRIASELSSPLAGALAGVLWLASPLVLGIGHLDGTDVPFALGVTLSSWALLRWLRLRDTGALVWLGLGLAAAAETQVTGLLVAASALAVVAASEWRSGVARAPARAGLAC